MMATRYWLASGTAENWQVAFKLGNIWGLKGTKRAEKLWERIAEGDALLFYVTRPSSGIVGFGKIRTKFKQDRPLWPDEIGREKVIWPLSVEFDVDFCLAIDHWAKRRVQSPRFRMLARSGFAELDARIALQVLEQLSSPGSQYVQRQPEKRSISARTHVQRSSVPIRSADSKSEPRIPLSHDEIKSRVAEIGRIQSFIAEEEYQMDGELLDVVWRRVERSVPTYVFEVQVAGDLHHALGKLKHAYDLWNSHIFLIVSERNRGKVGRLLQGTFHEIRDRVKLIRLDEIEELYHYKSSYKRLERELGIG